MQRHLPKIFPRIFDELAESQRVLRTAADVEHFGCLGPSSAGKACQKSTDHEVHRNQIHNAVPLAGEVWELTFAVPEQNGATRAIAFNPTRLRLIDAALYNGGSQDDDRNPIAVSRQ